MKTAYQAVRPMVLSIENWPYKRGHIRASLVYTMGRQLEERFYYMLSESSTGCWAVLQLPCHPSKQGKLSETYNNTFSTSCRPRLYMASVGPPVNWPYIQEGLISVGLISGIHCRWESFTREGKLRPNMKRGDWDATMQCHTRVILMAD